MYFDRYDIVSAYYLALSDCHTGQWSEEYRRLCKISSYFKAGHSLGLDSLTENGKTIYDAVCARLLAKQSH